DPNNPPGAIFLRRFLVGERAPADELAARVTELRAAMHSSTLPDLSEQQYRDLLTAARELLRAMPGNGGSDAGSPPPDTAPRPVGSANPRPAGSGSHRGHGTPPPVGPRIIY
ncbi:MAG TPA: hypothetical protein VFX30_09485, partial [bacterium]|nr:hypothetical protein [bacterium]